MKKTIVYIVIVIVLGIALYFGLGSNAPLEGQMAFDARNSSFRVEGAPVTLVDGVAVTEIASMPGVNITTRYFGNGISHDLDDDGREDTVFLVTQDGGGSGTFFYVVAVLNTVNGYVGSNSYPLGDRIAPQSTNMDEGVTSQGTMRDNVIVVNYAVRKPEEPMTAAPSVGKSVWLKLDPRAMEFGEVVQNFEGESR